MNMAMTEAMARRTSGSTAMEISQLVGQPLAMGRYAQGSKTPARIQSRDKLSFLSIAFLLAAIFASFPFSAQSQTFETVAPLHFSKTFGGANPLPQLFTVASSGTNFGMNATATTSTGGSWLTISPTNYCCISTPAPITAIASPATTLAAGTYTGQIVVKSDSGTLVMTIPVTLIIHATTDTYLDQIAGGLTFSLQTGGLVPPAQALQIRNAGASSLAWTATATTADGGKWLTISAAGGTAPSTLMASIKLAALPGLGITAGTFTGQVLLHSADDNVSVPITVQVGASVLAQINPLNFTKTFAGANPLPQVIVAASTGATFGMSAVVQNSTGDNWLSITPTNYCCTSTPTAITAIVNPAITLAAGTYTAEIVIEADNYSSAQIVPVTLTISPSTAAYFDDAAGSLNFSMETAGDAPPIQTFQIKNAGTGTLAWTAAATTADGGSWLTVSASGTAPSAATVTVTPAKLPSNGLAAGTFLGQVVVQSATSRITIPVSMTVGAAIFRQVNPLSFTKVFGGANPLPQIVNIASTGADFGFNAVVRNSTGGSWLTINPTNYCCTSTPSAITISAAPATTLAAGAYSAEVVIEADTGQIEQTIPVSLIIEPATATFFDSLPGQMSFSMVTKGNAPPAQPLEIRNAGAGTLDWTATTSTSDGGVWLSISPASGAAPAVPAVSVNPKNLPGGGLVAGTFTGQVTLIAASGRVTIPVTMTVGAAVFTQVNPLDFTKVFGGANPLPKMISIGSTGANFGFNAAVANSTGGNWLTINPTNYCCISTPYVLRVSVAPATTLAAGKYSAEIILKSNSGNLSLTVPVTLTVSAATVPFFADMPGGVDFFQATGGTAPAAQKLQIRNAGPGTLDWTAIATTADGGGWLGISGTSGTAPSTLTVSVNPAKMPGLGLTAGNFDGQILLVTTNGRETIPVTAVVGANVFKPLPPLAFAKAFGGANPVTQTLAVTSTATAFGFNAVAASATGGSWLVINPTNYCCTSTPTNITVSIAPMTTLAAGTYTAEVLFQSNAGDQGMVVPITMTIDSASATASPTFSPAGGSYSVTQSVTIKDATLDTAIYYTLDGTTPTTSSKVYSAPISVTATETIKAIAVANGFPQSAAATATYTITAPKAATPSVSQTITISEATSGAIVYYTTNGSTPTTSSAKYTVPIVVTSGTVLKFIAVAPGFAQSAVRTVTDTVQ
jgi:hypothetical protein